MSNTDSFMERYELYLAAKKEKLGDKSKVTNSQRSVLVSNSANTTRNKLQTQKSRQVGNLSKNASESSRRLKPAVASKSNATHARRSPRQNSRGIENNSQIGLKNSKKREIPPARHLSIKKPRMIPTASSSTIKDQDSKVIFTFQSSGSRIGQICSQSQSKTNVEKKSIQKKPLLKRDTPSKCRTQDTKKDTASKSITQDIKRNIPSKCMLQDTKRNTPSKCMIQNTKRNTLSKCLTQDIKRNTLSKCPTEDTKRNTSSKCLTRNTKRNTPSKCRTQNTKVEIAQPKKAPFKERLQDWKEKKEAAKLQAQIEKNRTRRNTMAAATKKVAGLPSYAHVKAKVETRPSKLVQNSPTRNVGVNKSNVQERRRTVGVSIQTGNQYSEGFGKRVLPSRSTLTEQHVSHTHKRQSTFKGTTRNQTCAAPKGRHSVAACAPVKKQISHPKSDCKQRKSILKTPLKTPAKSTVRNLNDSAMLNHSRRSTFENKMEVLPKDNLIQSSTTVRRKGRASVHFASQSCAPTPNSSSTQRKSLHIPSHVHSHSMREKLNDWLEKKGRTPSRFQHVMCFLDQKESTKNKTIPGGLTAKELSCQQTTLDQEACEVVGPNVNSPISMPAKQITGKADEVLAECLTLLCTGCPTNTVSSYLEAIISSYPSALHLAKYWICRAKISEFEGDDNLVINMYELATNHNAQPPQEIADALREYIESLYPTESAEDLPSLHGNRSFTLSPSTCTPQRSRRPSALTPRRVLDVQAENMFDSSSIKYLYHSSTPLLSRLGAGATPSSCPRGVVTPVRRSTRRSTAALPSMLHDHDDVFNCLEDMDAESKSNSLFVSNLALEGNI